MLRSGASASSSARSGQNGAAVYSANDDVTMRSLYGFALLDDEEPDRIAHAGSLAPDDNGAMI